MLFVAVGGRLDDYPTLFVFDDRASGDPGVFEVFVRDLQASDVVNDHVLLVRDLVGVLAADSAHGLGGRASVADRHHPVHLVRDAAVVRNDHHGQAALAVQIVEQVVNQVGGLGVDFTGRFVGQQDVRIVGQRHRNRHALLLPAGEFARVMAHPVAQADRIEQLARPIAPHPPGKAGEDHRRFDVFQRRQIGNQIAGTLLPDEAGDMPLVVDEIGLGAVDKVQFPHPAAAGRRPVQPAQDVQ